MLADLPESTSPADGPRQVWLNLAGAVLCSLLIHLWLFMLLAWPHPHASGGAGLRATLQVQPASVVPPIRQVATAQSTAPDAREKEALSQNVAPAAALAGGREASDARPVDNDQPYLPAEFLDVRPVFPEDLEARISEGLDEKDAGRVVLQLLIGADGRVDDVELEESELGEQASLRLIENLSRLQLVPGQRSGKPVRVRWHLEFTFSPAP